MIDLYGFGGTLAAGAWVTIKLALASLLFGLILGLIGAGAKLSRFFLLRTAADVFTTVVRGVPELVLVLAVYFGGAVLITGGAYLLAFPRGTRRMRSATVQTPANPPYSSGKPIPNKPNSPIRPHRSQGKVLDLAISLALGFNSCRTKSSTLLQNSSSSWLNPKPISYLP